MASLPPIYLTTVAFVLAIEYLLFGIHAVLSCCTFYIHHYRKAQGHNKSKIYPTISIVLLTLGTLALVLDSIAAGMLFLQPPGWSHKVDIYESINLIILNLSSITADTLLIYRLWLVWGRRWRIIFFPITLLLGAYVIGFVGAFQERGGFNYLSPSDREKKIDALALLMLSFANLLVTSLIAGRILWIWNISKTFGEKYSGARK